MVEMIFLSVKYNLLNDLINGEGKFQGVHIKNIHQIDALQNWFKLRWAPLNKFKKNHHTSILNLQMSHVNLELLPIRIKDITMQQ